jgi:hypothetical protein
MNRILKIKSHTGCLRTRWYFRGQGKGFHEIKKRVAERKRKLDILYSLMCKIWTG